MPDRKTGHLLLPDRQLIGNGLKILIHPQHTNRTTTRQHHIEKHKKNFQDLNTPTTKDESLTNLKAYIDDDGEYEIIEE